MSSAPSRSNAIRDRPHVARAVLADRDLHSRPLVDGSPAAFRTHGRTQRATDRLERGLGDVVRVAARRLDVDRGARGLREAGEHVRRHAGIELELQLGVRTATEVDRRPRERVVHRHDRVAVARDPAPVAERGVERRAERERRVLGGVVVARLEVAGAFEDEVEPGMERELLEKVVVEAGAGGDAHAARAVERDAHRDPRLGGRAQRAGAPTAARSDRRGPIEHPRERLDEQVVVRCVEHRDADRLRVGAHDQALPQQRLVRAPAPSSTGT